MKIKYRCEKVTIWEEKGGKILCFQNDLVNLVNGLEFKITINTDRQDFRPGRFYWLEIIEEESKNI